MTATALAPAKVNLFLHVGPLGADGYHPVSSWMVFADLGDTLRLEPAEAWSFAVDGPFASGLAGENLVVRAARLLFDRAGVPPPAARLTLTKSLPVAAGLGGGSSDAGAALRLLNAALPSPLPEAELLEVAAMVGADGPVCLFARPALARGRGEILTRAPEAPPLSAVLVNPGRPSSTGAVYRAYDSGPPAGADIPDLPIGFPTAEALAEALRDTRNDLEPPAVALEPAIGEVLAQLREEPEVLLARMSGSGATCFALCSGDADAGSLAARLAAARPDWWVRSCRLAGAITKS